MKYLSIHYSGFLIVRTKMCTTSESEWSLNDITYRADGTGEGQGGAFVECPLL